MRKSLKSMESERATPTSQFRPGKARKWGRVDAFEVPEHLRSKYPNHEFTWVPNRVGGTDYNADFDRAIEYGWNRIRMLEFDPAFEADSTDAFADKKANAWATKRGLVLMVRDKELCDEEREFQQQKNDEQDEFVKNAYSPELGGGALHVLANRRRTHATDNRK